MAVDLPLLVFNFWLELNICMIYAASFLYLINLKSKLYKFLSDSCLVFVVLTVVLFSSDNILVLNLIAEVWRHSNSIRKGIKHQQSHLQFDRLV